MGKGKGRQSGGFGYKSQRAVYAQEINEQISKQKASSQFRQKQPQNNNKASAAAQERPRLRIGLTHLKGILRERRTHESFLLAERRRRNGFLPSTEDADASKAVEIVSHPPGWIVNYGKRQRQRDDITSTAPQEVEPLQGMCLTVLAGCISDYLEAFGPHDFHGVLSLLPSDTLAKLSVAVSTSIGVTNTLAMVLGKHAHVEALSFRAATQYEDSLTDDGLLELVPLWDDSSIYVPDSWEDAAEDGGATTSSTVSSSFKLMDFDMLQVEGCNLRLKRLELIDCQSLSAEALITFFERCSCITYLSLSGSVPTIQDGINVFLSLPELLPALKILDVTRCAWISTSTLDSFMQCDYRDGKKPPTVHCEGCFRSTYQGTTLDW
jgi:hypothetical protein